MKTKLANINSNNGLFINGNPATGTLGTIVTAEWLNGVQERAQDVYEELRNVLLLGNLQPNPQKQNQVAEAIKAYCNNINLKVQSNTRNFDNYIPNSKKSNAVDSNSADIVATSSAVKTAYDKGVEAKSAADSALQEANKKLPLTGGTLTGNLSLKNGNDYNSILHYNTSGKYALSQGSPDSSPNFYAVAYFNSEGKRENGAFFQKSGGTEFVAYQSWVNDALGSYIQNNKKSNAVNSSSSDNVATSLAAKTAYDKGVEAKTAADNAQRTANAKQSPATTLAGYGITDGALAKGLTTENLNTVTKAGLYGQNANINATSRRNYPDTKAGALQVIDSAYGVMQVYTTWDTRYVFVRNQQPEGWSDWVRVDGLDRLPITGGTLTGNLSISSGDWSKIALLNNSGKQLIIEATPDSSSNIGNIVYRGVTNQNEAEINIPRKNGIVTLNGDVYYKNRYRYTAYPRHYHGAEVYKIPMSDTGGLMIVTLRADVNGRTTLNLPESFKAANYSVVANDVGGGRFVLSANRASGSQITVISVDGRDATASVQCIGWVDF